MLSWVVIVREQLRQPQCLSHLIFCFHALTNCPSRNSHRSIVLQMPRGGMGLNRIQIPSSPLNYSPRTTRYRLTPLESALAQNSPITPLESALTKSLDLKSFRIRTCEKGWGEGRKLLTRITRESSAPPRSGSMPTGPLQYWARGATITAAAETVPPLPVSKPVERTSGVEARRNAEPGVETVALHGSGWSGLHRRTGKAGIV
jgi:hypothetical protein